MPYENLTRLSEAIAADFRDWEEHEIVVFRNRDTSLVEWAFRCVINPRNEWAGNLLQKLQTVYDRKKAELDQEPTPEPVSTPDSVPADDLPF